MTKNKRLILIKKNGENQYLTNRVESPWTLDRARAMIFRSLAEVQWTVHQILDEEPSINLDIIEV